MALKDDWIPQDNTMDADADVVNKIADTVIKNEEDLIVVKKELKKIPTKTSELENDSNFTPANDVARIINYYIYNSDIATKEFVGTQINGVYGDLAIVRDIAVGRTFAVAYNNYEELVVWFNNNDRPNIMPPMGDIQIGQNIYIVALNVPDLWVSGIEDERIEYTYTTDEAFVNELNTNGFVRVGRLKFSALETQKVDLNNYATKEYIDEQLGVIENGSY